MNKKLLSLVLTLVMVLGAFTTVFAAETKATEKVEKVTGKDNKIQYVVDKKLVEGYEDGSLGLDKNITRAEITKLLAIANGNKDLAAKLQGAMKLYSDVDNSHWANGVITVGTTVPSATNGQPMLQGYPDGSFKPENNVTYAELAKMLVVLVKGDLTADMVKEANAKWAGLWLTWAQQLGILDDVTVADSNAAANRGDAFTMVYNALYKMKNFRRVAANEKLGVLSSLNRDKLVLNQDAKEQEYTITTDTVFVNTVKENTSNWIKVKDITNADYYLGSLVRIITNDKKEVTHILELGNPREMALGRAAGTIDDNSRWNGVADKTASTLVYDISTLKDKNTDNLSSYAEILFSNSNNTKVKAIKIMNSVGPVATANNGEFSVNSDTKVFVANPANNIMKEVKDINEALSLIGYRNYNGYRIPNVYVGFNTAGHTSAIKGFNASEATAKVVVFNVVTKEAKAELYRVINQTSTKGIATVENTDGKTFDRDFFGNMSAFPFNYGDLYDVIRVNFVAANGTDNIKTVIDHSDVYKFPVVEVTRLYDGNKSIEVRDVNGYKSVLNLRDADIFNATQYKELKEGAKVQFATTDKNVKVDVLSILPYDTRVEGSMRNVVDSIYGKTVVAKLLISNVNGVNSTITVDAYNNVFNQKDDMGRAFFYVTENDAKALKAYEGQEVVFDYTDNMNGVYGKVYADNFRLNDEKQTPIKPEVSGLEAYLALAKKADTIKATATNKAELEKLKEDLEKAEKYLTPADVESVPVGYAGHILEEKLSKEIIDAEFLATIAPAQAKALTATVEDNSKTADDVKTAAENAVKATMKNFDKIVTVTGVANGLVEAAADKTQEVTVKLTEVKEGNLKNKPVEVKVTVSLKK